MIPSKMAIGGNRHVLASLVGRLALCLGLISALHSPLTAKQDSDFSRAGSAALHSLVHVRARMPGQSNRDRPSWVHNTGYVVSEQGHVLTSLFAVGGAVRVEVLRLTGEPVTAELSAVHQPTGLAVLDSDLDQPPLHLASAEPTVGQWTVLATIRAGGEDRAASLSLHPALISSVSAQIRCYGLVHRDLLTFDTPCTPGSACAPILTSDGKVAAVLLNVMGTPGSNSCGYGLPARKLKPILDGLLDGKSTRSGWLGLAVQHMPETEGLEVRAVLAGSPGHKSGIQRGDVLLAIDGKSITSSDIFSSHVVTAQPGTRVKIRLLRGEQLKTLTTTVGTRPVIISRSVSGDASCAQRDARALTPRETIRKLRKLESANRQLSRMMEGMNRQIESLKEKIASQKKD
jgi:S1-C subfamily serine protease